MARARILRGTAPLSPWPVSLALAAAAALLAPGAAHAAEYVVVPVVLPGDSAPAGLDGQLFLFRLDQVCLDDSGTVVFHASLSPGVSGLFAASGGAVSKLLLRGDPAPGGGEILNLGGLSCNGSGQISFASGVPAGLFWPTDFVGNFIGTYDLETGAVAEVFREGEIGSPWSELHLSFLGATAINRLGHVVFQAWDPNAPRWSAGFASGWGLFLAADGRISRVPGAEDGVRSVAGINERGDVAYNLVVAGLSELGAFVTRDGVRRTIALPGDPIPGTDTPYGSVFAAAIDGAGDVAFQSSAGLFVDSGGEVSMVTAGLTVSADLNDRGDLAYVTWQPPGAGERQVVVLRGTDRSVLPPALRPGAEQPTLRPEFASINQHGDVALVASEPSLSSGPVRRSSCIDGGRGHPFRDCGVFVGLRIPEVALHLVTGSARILQAAGGRGVVPAALLGSDEFDVSRVERATLAFGPGGAAPAHRAGGHVIDVNGDGHLDLLSHYRVAETGITGAEAEVCVVGETGDAWPRPFEACTALVAR